MRSPYSALIHSWSKAHDEAKKYANDSDLKRKCAGEDLKDILRWISTSSGDEDLGRYFKSREKFQEGRVLTFDCLWALFPKGTLIIAKPFLKEHQIFFVQSVTMPDLEDDEPGSLGIPLTRNGGCKVQVTGLGLPGKANDESFHHMLQLSKAHKDIISKSVIAHGANNIMDHAPGKGKDIVIEYNDLDQKQKESIFMEFLTQLKKKSLIDPTKRESIKSWIEEEGRNNAFNGRQIRNIVPTAMGLAHAEQEIGKKGPFFGCDEHVGVQKCASCAGGRVQEQPTQGYKPLAPSRWLTMVYTLGTALARRREDTA
ncbi:hypothetical protein DL770_009561 [Monosporascus sp. CRB-9-2]|nr:hypothetical protein DL770_009561 [Monosporascus sp. CRB-9-2]